MDKRSRERKKMRLAVRFGADAPDTLGYITDVSAGGLHISTNKVLPPGSPIALQVQLPGGEMLSLRGRVARSKRVPQALVTMVRGGMGVRLEHPPIDWRASLALPADT